MPAMHLANSPTTSANAPYSRRERFVRGVKLGMPIFLGYAPVGMAFGIIARSLDFSVLQAGLCSATALAGAGQFIALAVMKSGGGIAAVLTATTVVNLRYVLFGATMSPHLSRFNASQQAALAFLLTDETFAVNINDVREGQATGTSMLGVGAISWTGWVGGTIVGAAAAGWIGDPSRWGVDFAMAAMFVALFIAMAEDRRHVAIGLLAGAVAIGLPALGLVGIEVPSSAYVIVASMTAATVGAAIERD